MKLRKLHIEDYKMFKDFDIDFVDENDEALPVVVLAGVNGSGKTTLLEYLYNNFDTLHLGDNNFIEFQDKNINIKSTKASFQVGLRQGNVVRLEKEIKELKKLNSVDKSLIYFSTDESIENVEELMPEYLRRMVWDEDIKASEAFKRVRDYANDIFVDIDIQIEFDSRDGEKKLYFRNKNGGDRFLISGLSTGEKTLVSKVLYMYLADIKNKVILIDEPELSLHPSWQNKILEIYEKFSEQNNCQIIIATHSPHIIGSAKPEYLRVLKKVDNKIEVAQYTQSYGLEFNKILTDIMGAETRVSDVSEQLSKIKSLIIQNDFDSDEFKTIWSDLERLLGIDNIDLRLLKLEIASRKKNVSNN